MITNTRFFMIALGYLAFAMLWLLKTPVDFLYWLLAGLDRWLDRKLKGVL